MALGATLFAFMNFFARLASGTASWASVGAVRALVGAVVAIGFARARGHRLVFGDQRALFWRSLFGTGAMVSTFYALSSRTLSLGDTATLLNLTPVFLAIFAPLILRERTSAAVAVAIVLSLGGVVLVLRPAVIFGAGQAHAADATAIGPSAPLTAAVAVLAALLSSIAMMMLRRVGQQESPEAIATHFSLFAATTLGLLTLLDPKLPTSRDFLYMLAAGMCAGFAQLAMTRAYSLENAARVGGMSYLAVVVSALLGAAALRETPSALAIGGMVLVIAGGLVVTLTRDRATGRAS